MMPSRRAAESNILGLVDCRVRAPDHRGPDLFLGRETIGVESTVGTHHCPGMLGVRGEATSLLGLPLQRREGRSL